MLVRNANNAVGIARYGNKFYANDGGTLREIDQSTYDAGRHSKLTAQKLKDGYVEDIKSTLVPADTPDITDPESKPGSANRRSCGQCPVSVSSQLTMSRRLEKIL